MDAGCPFSCAGTSCYGIRFPFDITLVISDWLSVVFTKGIGGEGKVRLACFDFVAAAQEGHSGSINLSSRIVSNSAPKTYHCGNLAQLQTQDEKIINLTQKRLKKETFSSFCKETQK